MEAKLQDYSHWFTSTFFIFQPLLSFYHFVKYVDNLTTVVMEINSGSFYDYFLFQMSPQCRYSFKDRPGWEWEWGLKHLHCTRMSPEENSRQGWTDWMEPKLYATADCMFTRIRCMLIYECLHWGTKDLGLSGRKKLFTNRLWATWEGIHMGKLL